jgi:hypothetical protein
MRGRTAGASDRTSPRTFSPQGQGDTHPGETPPSLSPPEAVTCSLWLCGNHGTYDKDTVTWDCV